MAIRSEIDVLARLRRLDSTVISDTLDSFGLAPGTGDLTALWGSPRLVGMVRTVQLELDSGGPPVPHIASTAIAKAHHGDVLVVANSGRLDVSCWGGLLSLGCVVRGVAGVIADGACRDVAEAQRLGFPVFARAVTPRTARGRLRQVSTGQPVDVAGITVCDGDLVLADDSGVAFVPLRDQERVLDSAEQLRDREHAIAADLRAGISIAAAMHDARLAGSEVHQHGQ